MCRQREGSKGQGGGGCKDSMPPPCASTRRGEGGGPKLAACAHHVWPTGIEEGERLTGRRIVDSAPPLEEGRGTPEEQARAIINNIINSPLGESPHRD